MRSIIYYVAASLDGFIATDDGDFSQLAGEGQHVEHYLERIQGWTAVLMGRKTYEVGLAHGVTDPYPWMETYVASSTLKPRANNVQVVSDPVAVAAKLRDGKGSPIYLCGGTELATTLFANRLIDELWVKVSPVLLGRGKAVMARPAPLALKLLGTKAHPSGVVTSRYSVCYPGD